MDAMGLQRGASLFNAGEYFEAHEVWEDVWRAAPVEEKKFLQGLIQIAVALHHQGRGNLVGARSLLARAQRNLSDCPDDFAGINMAAVRKELAGCQKATAEGKPFGIRIQLQT